MSFLNSSQLRAIKQEPLASKATNISAFMFSQNARKEIRPLMQFKQLENKLHFVLIKLLYSHFRFLAGVFVLAFYDSAFQYLVRIYLDQTQFGFIHA